MEHRSTVRDDATQSIDNLQTYLDDDSLECDEYLPELHAQHEGSRATIHSMDESPEASVVRYSFWSIM